MPTSFEWDGRKVYHLGAAVVLLAYSACVAFNVTFSAGVVAAGPGESLESAVARADSLLYQAKQAGRNRVLGLLS